jgi:ParB/Sulfiredoxin domain
METFCLKNKSYKFKYIDTNLDPIDPPHRPWDESKLAKIAQNMASDGWDGLPLVVYRDARDGRLQSITGSHRLAAAQLAGISMIPVVETKRIQACDLPEDYEYVLDALKERGCKAAVIAVMREERV